MKDFLIKHRMPIFLSLALIIHAAAFLWIRFALPPSEAVNPNEYAVLKLVDIEEYIPPVMPPLETKVSVVTNRPGASEEIVETKETVIEVADSNFIYEEHREPEYLPQHKISQIPDIPSKEVLSRIVYPPMALRQNIEAIVYLELYIDSEGNIRKIQVLKDPGHGFADAAIAALEGIRCSPARANGTPVAVRFRYPVRFTLN